MKLVVTIPAYNEEKTISRVIEEISSSMEGSDSVEIIVVDDGSNDGTVNEAIKAGAHEVVLHGVNKGLGVTFRDGLEAAIRRGADIIVNIDADGQYNAGQIPDLIRPISERKADIVLGWRNISELDHMPPGKKIGNKLATWVTRQLAGFPVIDAQTGFRAFSREAAQRLYLCGNYTYVQETLIQANHKGLLIEQVPIEFRRRDGKSRLIPSLSTYALRAGSTIFGTYRDYHPLKFFMAVGGIIGLAGLGFGARVLIHFSQTGMVSPFIPSAVLSSLLIIVGLGAMALGLFMHMLNSQRRLLEEVLYRLKKNGG
ncbi:MAG: glycosyltransferase family 2 protein [Dehalococcoidales bacterium]|nr:glycosyltransferase family 2 protein [Dehalococcoidales bacterium]MDZ4246816.1 glycosyltransferase family 2 protein [Dehalococcoidia bacterium]